ncbi:MAG: protein kinase domain-containing protein [Planctomycetota bacterium]
MSDFRSDLPRQIGRYLIDERIGTGGMSVVYKARDPKLDKKVALKQLLPEFANDPDKLRRFIDEVRRIARLDDHESILKVFDYGEAEGGPYITMQLLVGGDLATQLDEGAPLSSERVRSIVAAIGGALEYAHRHGVVHCDVKPSNILIDRLGKPFLADFGISRVINDLLAGDEQMPSIYTPKYASPEQVRGLQPDERSDIYSLAVVVYEMCAGVSPYGDRPSLSALCDAIVGEPPAPPSRHNPSVPAALDAALLAALAKDPEGRPQDVGAFVRSVMAALDAAPTPASERTTQVSPGPLPQQPAAPRGGGGGLLVAVLLLAMVGGGVWWFWPPLDDGDGQQSAESDWTQGEPTEDDANASDGTSRRDGVPADASVQLRVPPVPPGEQRLARILLDTTGSQPEVAAEALRQVRQMAAELSALPRYGVVSVAVAPQAVGDDDLSRHVALAGADAMLLVRLNGRADPKVLPGVTRYRLELSACELLVAGLDPRAAPARTAPVAAGPPAALLANSAAAAAQVGLQAVLPKATTFARELLQQLADAKDRPYLVTFDADGAQAQRLEALCERLRRGEATEVELLATAPDWRVLVRSEQAPAAFVASLVDAVAAEFPALRDRVPAAGSDESGSYVVAFENHSRNLTVRLVP